MSTHNRDDFDAPELAYSMALTPCTAKCSCHVVLFDADGVPFAEAALTPALAKYFGRALTRIGAGEDAKAVMAEMRRESLT